ncbi:MAG TPA: serine hydrolase domain-containing protein [Gammaproteobacteria bacterium]
MRFRIAFTLLIMITLTGCGPMQTSASRVSLIDKARIDAALKDYTDKGAPPGVSALIYENGKEAYFGAFGMADREANRPMVRDTLAQIYSMTKPITGVALMMLYEEGKFSLDDPLAKHAPEFADLKVFNGLDENNEPILTATHRPVKIRDITRHTGGFTDRDNESRVGERYRELDPTHRENTLSEMAQKLGQIPLLYQPGTRWLYGPSVDIQAFLVERLSGMPFDQFLQARVFKPLGMHDTRYVVSSPEDRERLAAVYELNDDGTMRRADDETAFGFNTHDWPLKPGGFGLVSTLDDYMRFARMLLNEGELDGVRLLKPETVRLMAGDAMPEAVTDKSWLPVKGQVGFGINFAVRIAPPAGPDEPSGAVGEFFWDGKANTLFWVDPKNNIAAVLFTQYFPPGDLPLHKAFRDAVYYADDQAYAR